MKAPLHTMWCRLHTVAGRRGTGTALAILMALAALVSVPVNAAPVAVRFPEGIAHGFLLVRSLAGEIIGQGEMTQVVKEGDLVESQLVFNFKDGSLHDEKVTFSQQRVFTMLRYHLVQRGPSFPDQIEVSIDRGRRNTRFVQKTGEDGKEEVLTGAVDLPKDVYNGIFVTMSLNLPKGAERNGELSRLHAGARGHQTGAACSWVSTPSRSATCHVRRCSTSSSRTSA